MLILGGREWASTPDRYRQEWVRPALHGVQGSSRQYSTVHTGINLSLIGAIRQGPWQVPVRYGEPAKPILFLSGSLFLQNKEVMRFNTLVPIAVAIALSHQLSHPPASP